MILKIVNVDNTFVRTCERSNTFTNADERSQKINVNVQNSINLLNNKKNPIFILIGDSQNERFLKLIMNIDDHSCIWTSI